MLTRARAHPVLAVGVVLAVVLLANAAVASYRSAHEKIDACGLLPASVVRSVLGVASSGEPFEPDGGDRSATGCTFGRGADGSITVFATPDDAGYFARTKELAEQHGASFEPSARSTLAGRIGGRGRGLGKGETSGGRPATNAHPASCGLTT
jgi:hypothetical protein